MYEKNVSILGTYWTHIRPRFSRRSIWSPLTWFTLRIQRNLCEFKMIERWRRWGRAIWPFVLGLQLLLESPEHHWVPEQQQQQQQNKSWGNRICEHDVKIPSPMVQVVLQFHVVPIPPGTTLKVCTSVPNWKCEAVQFLSPCILTPWKPCWTFHSTLKSSETPGSPDRVTDMK